MSRDKKKYMCMGALLCLSMNLLAGCKEKTVDYSMESATESTQEGNGASKLSRGKRWG